MVTIDCRTMCRQERELWAPVEDAGHIITSSDGPVQMVIRGDDIQRPRAAIEESPYEQREAIMVRMHADMRCREIQWYVPDGGGMTEHYVRHDLKCYDAHHHDGDFVNAIPEDLQRP